MTDSAGRRAQWPFAKAKRTGIFLVSDQVSTVDGEFSDSVIVE